MQRAAGWQECQACPAHAATAERARRAAPLTPRQQTWQPCCAPGAGPGALWAGLWLCGRGHVTPMVCHRDVASGAVTLSGSSAILLCCFLREVAGNSPADSVLPPLPIPSCPFKSFGRAQLSRRCCSEAANQAERSQTQAASRGAQLSLSQEAGPRRAKYCQPRPSPAIWEQVTQCRQSELWGGCQSLFPVVLGSGTGRASCREHPPSCLCPGSHAGLSQGVNTFCV